MSQTEKRCVGETDPGPESLPGNTDMVFELSSLPLIPLLHSPFII